MTEKKKIDWQHWSMIIAMLCALFTIIGSFVAMPIYLGNKIDSNFLYLNQKIDQGFNEMRFEMRELHGRVTACEVNVGHIKDFHNEVCWRQTTD